MVEIKLRGFVLFVLLLIICFLFKGCALVNKKASEYSFGEECSHCHGKSLEGNRNVKKECGSCHERVVLSVQNVKSIKIKEIVLSDPHVHVTKNLFGDTPSCFNCHRQNDF